ncbi:hypothetical protein V1525DRAFT_409859 [Lipomyces kononenkoae]|uniref:Uncharacterized protein n=1 Tax=Lipomyces kononenkoae TaxID=34357 RepID=A0ACC3SVN9_LIPKO
MRLPLVLGVTFAYVYWKFCFYQPRTTTTSRKSGKSRGLGRPVSDDEDEDDNHSFDVAQKQSDEEEDVVDLTNAVHTSTTLSSDNSSAPIVTTATTARKVRPTKVFRRRSKDANTQPLPTMSDIYIFYSTLTGTSEKYASHLHAALSGHSELSARRIHAQNLDYIDDLDTYFVTPARFLENAVYLFVLPSYASESPLDFFVETLKDTYNDFRIDSRPLRKLGGYAVFGLGDREGWDEDMYCYQAMAVDKYLGKLGAPRVFPVGTGNVSGRANDEFEEWIKHLSDVLADPTGVGEIIDVADSDDEGVDAEDDAEDEAFDDTQPKSLRLSKTASAKDVIDVEDMGAVIERSRKSNDSTTKKEMVGKDTPTYNALTKQGYTIVGSHSGVKICRWTKSALRGRGSCYKFAFYGIKSHLCMETTPSLSCSNKCVFCWRHGTNPVGTTWRWQVDPPELILKGALEGHYRKIKQMRGVPGVQAARFAEAFTVRHCALSLVGEPIFYPHINEFVRMLHERSISSFLVCNAQHPDQLKALDQVTQLYVSIDASDKESLRRIDRPLHRDFWERFNQCLDILRSKTRQRTVFRLTLVKGFNASDVLGYAKLVAQALPCFIEIKGVTYCGTASTASEPNGAFKGVKKDSLTMANVPFYDEVRGFVLQLDASLKDLGLNYEVAAEHAHSCCILIAQTRFKIDGEWYTHIDYDRFFELLREGREFGPMDYIAKTPPWAIFGSDQAGFNPEDERVVNKKSKAYKSEQLAI